jgi:hypothetical protein
MIKSCAIVLLCLTLSAFVFCQDADELEHKIQSLQSEIQHQQFIIENEMIWQKTILELNIDMMIRKYQTRMITERLLYDIYRPTYIMREFTDCLYLPFFPPLIDELPLFIPDLEY